MPPPPATKASDVRPGLTYIRAFCATLHNGVHIMNSKSTTLAYLGRYWRIGVGDSHFDCIIHAIPRWRIGKRSLAGNLSRGIKLGKKKELYSGAWDTLDWWNCFLLASLVVSVVFALLLIGCMEGLDIRS